MSLLAPMARLKLYLPGTTGSKRADWSPDWNIREACQSTSKISFFFKGPSPLQNLAIGFFPTWICEIKPKLLRNSIEKMFCMASKARLVYFSFERKALQHVVVTPPEWQQLYTHPCNAPSPSATWHSGEVNTLTIQSDCHGRKTEATDADSSTVQEIMHKACRDEFKAIC